MIVRKILGESVEKYEIKKSICLGRILFKLISEIFKGFNFIFNSKMEVIFKKFKCIKRFLSMRKMYML